MIWRTAALLLTVFLVGCAETSTGGSSPLATGSTTGDAAAAQKAAQLPKCERPLGTAMIMEKEIVRLHELGLTQPTPLLRLMMAESNCFQVVDAALAGKPVKIDYYMSADILSQNKNAGGFGGGIGKALPGWAGAIAGGIDANVQEAQTAIYLSSAKTGIQVAAATGSAQTTDVGFSTASLGRGFASAGGAYSNTPMGKTVSAAFVDAYAKLVAQVQAMTPLQATVPPPKPASKPKKQAAAN